MKSSWLMPCLGVVLLAALVLIAAGVEAGALVAVGAVAVCPLMMLLMMGGGMHRLTRRHQGDHETADAPTPEDVTTSS